MVLINAQNAVFIKSKNITAYIFSIKIFFLQISHNVFVFGRQIFQSFAQHKYFLLLSTICRNEQKNLVYINIVFCLQINTIHLYPYLQNQGTWSIWKALVNTFIFCVHKPGNYLSNIHLITFLSVYITEKTFGVVCKWKTGIPLMDT